MVVAIMTTEHFDFVVFANSNTEAKNLMNKAFKQHIKECNTDWTKDCSATDWYGCDYNPVVNNAVFRDGMRMKEI